MTFEERMNRLNSLMAGDVEGYDVARKLDKLPEKRSEKKEPEKPKLSLVPEFESKMRDEMDRITRYYDDYPAKFKFELPKTGPYWSDPGVSKPFWEAAKEMARPPEEHRYRYPVRKPRSAAMSLDHRDGGTLPPPVASFADQELRYTDGDTNVEVWEGEKMVARIPVHALQSVLMNELLEAVGYYE